MAEIQLLWESYHQEKFRIVLPKIKRERSSNSSTTDSGGPFRSPRAGKYYCFSPVSINVFFADN